MIFRPDVTVAALIEREGRFLLVQERIAGRLVLNQPAGHLEQGESLIAAVERETLEETGCRFTPEWLLGLYLWPHPGATGTTLRIAFVGSVGPPDASRALDEPVVAIDWLSREELAARRSEWRTPLVMQCVEDYLSGRRLPLEAIAG